MSLDVMLYRSKLVSFDEGKSFELESDLVFEANITHNLARMAQEANIYEVIWRPEEMGFEKASDLIPSLENGYLKLAYNEEYFQKFNPSNGWGTYENLVSFVKRYIDACQQFPNAEIEISR